MSLKEVKLMKGNLGFGLMRLPQRSPEPTDVDADKPTQMVDAFLDGGFTYFDTSYDLYRSFGHAC